MKVLITGANGFLGWHTRLRLHALSDHSVVPVGREDWHRLPELLGNVDAVIHVAGVNRAPTSAEVELGNVVLAEDLATAIRKCGRPLRVVYTNSIQAGNETPYGIGKQRSGEVLRAAVEATDGHLVDVMMPNLFGEHGTPHYNSFVATFVAGVVAGHVPTINDNEVSLLHAQQAAQVLLDALTSNEGVLRPLGSQRRVREVWELLQEFQNGYLPSGEMPDLSEPFAIDLFNTYRAALFPKNYPIRLVPHTDARGTFVETARSRGGEGQSSVSTTMPGVTRGEHYHLRKIERFAVISGSATIELRKMFTEEVLSFSVSGDRPAAVDMPVGWVHNITNTGSDVLLTQFWSHEIFDPEAPDTFPEKVRQAKENSP